VYQTIRDVQINLRFEQIGVVQIWALPMDYKSKRKSHKRWN